MPDQHPNRFSSKITMILSVLGIAIGTGNIWRFPRIVAQNSGEDGGGGFILIWLFFLFAWSIPLIVAEYAMGKFGRRGVIGSYERLAGKSNQWKGGFIVIVTTAIMFYYSVVVGWCIFYLIQSLKAVPISDINMAIQVWDGFQSGYTPAAIHVAVMLAAAFVVINGIKSIERVNSVLIPALLMIVFIALFQAVQLENAWSGIQFLFTPDFTVLTKAEVWLEALTQNAWDTGAGWGLILAYASYMRAKDSVISSAVQTGLGNNLVSLLAATIIFSTVFGALGSEYSNTQILDIMRDSGPASTGLTFIWIPVLFQNMPFGQILGPLFFLGLTFAAFSSLLSMVEMASRVFIDLKISRRLAVIIVTSLSMLFGLPSALNLTFFANQDFVWGIGLILSGAIISLAISQFGAKQLLDEVRPEEHDPGFFYKYWPFVIKYIIPFQATVLVGWWLYRSIFEFASDDWYNPLSPYSLATCLVQWGVAALVLKFSNHQLFRE